MLRFFLNNDIEIVQKKVVLDKITLIGVGVGSIAIISAIIWLLAEHAGVSFKMLEP